MCCFINVQDEPYGAVGDGTTDDRTAIQSAIDACYAQGGGRVYVPPGTYRLTRNGTNSYCLLLKSGVELFGASARASVLKMANSTATSVRLIYTTGADDAALSDLTLDGNKSNQTVNEQRHGIFATTCNRLRVSRVISKNFTGDGFYLYAGANGSVFSECYVTANDRNGITFGATLNDCTLTACIFSGNVAQQVDSEPGSGSIVSDIRILGCTLDGAGVSSEYVLTCSGDGGSTSGTGWQVIGNTLRGPTRIGRITHGSFIGNKVYNGTDLPGFDVYKYAKSVTIADNTIQQTITTGNEPGIGMLGSNGDYPDDIVVEGNAIMVASAAAYGISAEGCTSVTINNNTIEGTGVFDSLAAGIVVRATNSTYFRSAVVVGNTIRNFGDIGISIRGNTALSATISALDVSHNVVENDAGSMTKGIAMSADEGATLAATVVGNQFVGTFSSAKITWPSTPVLIGGNRGAAGVYSLSGSPEGVLTEIIGAIASDRAGVTYYKASGTSNTGWIALPGAASSISTSLIAADAVTFAKMQNLTSDRLLGRDTAGTGDPEEIGVGGGLEFTGSAAIQRSALTGDVTASAGSNATTIASDAVTTAKILNDAVTTAKILDSNVTTAKIADDAVTLAKMANVATARLLGRSTAGTGDPEALTGTQATALLDAVTTSAKGLVPTAPNDTTKFLRGDGSWAAPKQKCFLRFGGAVMTAGNTDRYPNPIGLATSPIGATGIGYEIPVTGYLVATRYRVTTAHTTNTVTVTPRVNGVEQTTQTMTINATVATQYTVHATPLAVTAGDYIAAQMDHNGATNLANLDITFEIEF